MSLNTQTILIPVVTYEPVFESEFIHRILQEQLQVQQMNSLLKKKAEEEEQEATPIEVVGAEANVVIPLINSSDRGQKTEKNVVKHDFRSIKSAFERVDPRQILSPIPAAGSPTDSDATESTSEAGSPSLPGRSDGLAPYKPKTTARKYQFKPENEKKHAGYKNKRARNNDAVRKSREKAKQEQQKRDADFESMRKQITELKKSLEVEKKGRAEEKKRNEKLMKELKKLTAETKSTKAK